MATTRAERARERTLRLTFHAVDCGNERLIQRQTDDGEWGDAHVLTVDGTDAVDCTCPDDEYRDGPCYHRIAYSDGWHIDQIQFTSGEVVTVDC